MMLTIAVADAISDCKNKLKINEVYIYTVLCSLQIMPHWISVYELSYTHLLKCLINHSVLYQSRALNESIKTQQNTFNCTKMQIIAQSEISRKRVINGTWRYPATLSKSAEVLSKYALF